MVVRATACSSVSSAPGSHPGGRGGGARHAGSLEPDELALTARAGLSPTRQALFSFLLSEPDLAELDAFVHSHELEVRIP